MGFPKRTAGTCTLPDGTEVWVQTLNSPQKDDVIRQANKYASMQCADIVQGSPGWKARYQQAKSFDVDRQSTLLANHLYKTEIFREVSDAFPQVPEPERGEKDEAEYTKDFNAWQKATKKQTAEKIAYEEKLYKQAVEDAKELPPKVRVDRCMAAWFAEEFGTCFARRYVYEQVYRAVRKMDEPSVPFFDTVDDVIDLDDNVLEALIGKYNELDTMKIAEIPTLPATS